MDFLTLALMGAFAGMMAGLLGIGGGAIIVPVLVIVFGAQGVNPDVIMHVALGTSLATIVFTALSSIYAHQRRGAVLWPLVRRLTPGIVGGSLLGAGFAHLLPSRVLHYLFAVFLLFVAVQMARGSFATAAQRKLPGTLGTTFAGLTIGVASALFGVGGGSLTVPFLTWCSVPVRQAVATAAAVGLPIALAGSAGYVLAGWNAAHLPPWSVGYVVLPAFAGIVIASTLFAPLGAHLAHRIPELLLRRVFALFLALLGLRMLLS